MTTDKPHKDFEIFKDITIIRVLEPKITEPDPLDKFIDEISGEKIDPFSFDSNDNDETDFKDEDEMDKEEIKRLREEELKRFAADYRVLDKIGLLDFEIGKMDLYHKIAMMQHLEMRKLAIRNLRKLYEWYLKEVEKLERMEVK